jgi:hypothetical protein
VGSAGEMDRIYRIQDYRIQDYRMNGGGVVGLWRVRGRAGHAVVRVWRCMRCLGWSAGEMDRIYWIQDSQDGRRLGGGALAKSGDVRAMLW